MTVEDFAPAPGRDLGPLIHALRRNGGTLTFAEWVSVPNSMTINLHLPDDPEQAAKVPGRHRTVEDRGLTEPPPTPRSTQRTSNFSYIPFA